MFPWEQVDGLWATKSKEDGETDKTDRRTDNMQSQYRALH